MIFFFSVFVFVVADVEEFFRQCDPGMGLSLSVCVTFWMFISNHAWFGYLKNVGNGIGKGFCLGIFIV